MYVAIIDTLWGTGVVWAQSYALTLFGTAISNGHFRRDSLMANGPCGAGAGAGSVPPQQAGHYHRGGGGGASGGKFGGGGGGGGGGGALPARTDLNLHAMTAGVAMLSLYTWLQDIR